METQDLKCVMVVDENLPLGIITNTAAVMGIALAVRMITVIYPFGFNQFKQHKAK